MPKFNTYVSVYKDPAEHVEFAPGDDVPDWALDKVGSHVYEDSEEVVDVRLTDPHYEEDEDAVRFQTVNTLPPTRPEVADDVDDDEEVDYHSMKKDELVALAEERDLDSSGTKAEIIERLEADDEE